MRARTPWWEGEFFQPVHGDGVLIFLRARRRSPLVPPLRLLGGHGTIQARLVRSCRGRVTVGELAALFESDCLALGPVQARRRRVRSQRSWDTKLHDALGPHQRVGRRHVRMLWYAGALRGTRVKGHRACCVRPRVDVCEANIQRGRRHRTRPRMGPGRCP